MKRITRGQRRYLLLPAVILFLLFVLSLAGPWLVSTAAGGRPEAVFILGESPGRIRSGAASFRSTGAGRVILTLNRPTPAAVALLEEEGVPRSSTRVVYGVASTADEAGVARTLMQECVWRQIVVVTSALHTRRASFLFRKAVGSQGRVSVLAADSGPTWMWWARPRLIEDVTREWLKLGAEALRFRSSRPKAFEAGVDC